ncbi:STAT protein, DNA binding domain-containing protein [Ditylenchus destructor]|nr:STAT protein, DNA binding domain-containing protein [Ditylenchus destructor]
MYGSPISSSGENSNQGYKMDYCDGTGAMSNPMAVADSLSLASTPNPMNTAQSPGGTVVMGQVVDSNFVHRHNFSVEIYQAFKEDVDLLFSGGVPLQDQSHFISRILQNAESLIGALETEKQYLMSEVLCSWAVQQQKLSIATLWTQQMNYNLLNTIDTQFEYFGELLEQSLSGLGYLIEHYPRMGFEELYTRIRHIAHLFLFYSVIVSRQPPAVVVKCGEAENHRRSRFWFNTEIRVLGGRAFGIHQGAENLQVQCFLITDETAKKLRTNAYYEVRESEQFVIEPSVSHFKTFGTDAQFQSGSGISGGFVAKFDDMRVSKKEQLRREEVWKKRYHLCYNIRLSASKHGIELIGKKVSLPFAILVGPKWDVEAKLFLERSFADFIRRPDSEPPQAVPFSDMADALEMKFQAILETPQKSTDQIPLIQPRAFTYQSKQHLISRLKPDAQGNILVENFLKMPAAEEYCQKRDATDKGEWKLVPFFEWFFKLAELVNKNFVQMWNEGLIFGFCGKDEAEQLLSECHRPTLLIRFSDIEFGKIKISVKDNYNVIRHHWYDHQDLASRNLIEELANNSKYRDVECIYPNTSLEMVIGARDKHPAMERLRKPRNLQPSPIYFNNQEPAMRMNSF